MEILNENTVKDEIESFLKVAVHESVIDGGIGEELYNFIDWYLLNYR